jgi:hypothetical protein
MWTAAQDPHTPAWHGDLVQRGVADPSLVTRTVVPNAGHFSFLSPFPDAITNPAFPPSQDPPGFDRAQFQESLHPAILDFLRRALAAAS